MDDCSKPKIFRWSNNNDWEIVEAVIESGTYIACKQLYNEKDLDNQEPES